MGKTSVSTRALVENEINNSATYTPTPNDDSRDADIFFRQLMCSPPKEIWGYACEYEVLGSEITGVGGGLSELLHHRTQLERLLMIVLLCLLIALCFVIVIIFAIGTAKPIPESYQDCGQEVCLTETCVRVAGEILAKMNKSVDPCSDFYTYSCGKWLTETIPPDNYGSWNAFQELNEQLKLKTKRILDTWGKKSPKGDETPSGEEAKQSKGKNLLDAQAKTYTFYKSCESSARETLGPAPMLEILTYMGESTIFKDSAAISNTEFRDTDKRITERFGGSFFYDLAVYPKNSNTTQNILTIGPRTDLSLGPYSTYKNITVEDPRMKAFKYAMEEAFYLLTRSLPDLVLNHELETRIKQKIQEIVDLEVEFSKLITDQDLIQMMPTEQTYLITNLTTLKGRVPQVDWDGILGYLFQNIEVSITDDEPIQLLDPDFFQKVGPFLSKSSKETLQNYQYWRVIDISMGSINHDFEIIKANLTLVVKGSNSGMRPRWEQCVNLINSHSIVGNVIGAEFIRTYFRPESKKKIQNMIESIRSSFMTSLRYLRWLDPITRAYAIKKAHAMHDFLAYPDQLLNDSYVGSLLHAVKFSEDTYYVNQLALGHFTSRQDLLKLRKPVDKAEWEMTPQQINAYYVPAKNSFTFPAGILQKPFYSEEYPMSFNYGGIGVVVGHELTHGFDTQGRTYDLEGNQREWFKNDTAAKFSDLSQCFVKQYSKYKVFGMPVDGVLTLGENIADNGGIKNSYQAYKKFEEINGKELLYPGLGLTHDQVFFVAFGQIWCNIVTEESARYRIESDSHAPEQIRVPGAVSNLKEFADAFGCRKDAPMNPSNKCAIW